MSEARSSTKPGLSLVGLLAVAVFFELWCNRIAARLVRLDPANPLAGALRRIDGVSFFLFEFVSIFAAFLFVGALVRIVRSSRYRGPTRLSFGLVGGVAAALVIVGTAIRLPPRYSAHLLISAIFLLLVIALGALALPAPRRLRAGIGLLVVPLAMMLLANLLQRFSAAGVVDPRASVLAETAGAIFVLVGLTSPWLFGPDRAAGPFAYTLAATTAGVGLVLGKLDWDNASRLAGIGIGVVIPIGPIGMPIYVVGASAMAFTIGALVVQAGPDRLRAIGLFIVCAVGLQLELPYQIASSLLGMLCLLEVATLPPANAITREELDALLRRFAALVGATQVTVVGSAGEERARIAFSPAENLAASLLVDRRASAIIACELTVGEVAERAPPFTIASRGLRLKAPMAPGPIIATGEPAFDRRYIVRDHRSAGAALLDVETRARIARLVDGWVGVWPQRGARFRGRALPSGDDGLPSLVQLLSDLRARSGT